MGQDVEHKYFVTVILPAVKTWLVKVVDVFEGKCFLLESLKEFSEQKFNEDLALNIFRQF